MSEVSLSGRHCSRCKTYSSKKEWPDICLYRANVEGEVEKINVRCTNK